jgi:hypothetical protein
MYMLLLLLRRRRRRRLPMMMMTMMLKLILLLLLRCILFFLQLFELLNHGRASRLALRRRSDSGIVLGGATALDVQQRRWPAGR